MSIELSIRPTTPTEDMYTYTQSSQIQGQTGCIGHLRADMDSNGEGFFSSWDDHRGYLKTDQVKEEFDQVINQLRFGTGDENGIRHENDDCFLKNRSALARYCWSQPSARMQTDEEYYGFRVDTDSYTYTYPEYRFDLDEIRKYCINPDKYDFSHRSSILSFCFGS